jgi:branched-chain amino acid transport system ATP-binding protein
MSGGLKIQNLTVARGGKQVLHGVDLDIQPGRITTLLGANGAGKSSLVLAIAGALPASGGKVVLEGRTITGLRPEIVRGLGVAAVPEGHQVLGDLSVKTI